MFLAGERGGLKVRCVLQIFGWFVIKYLQGSTDAIVHEKNDLSFFIVPFKVESEVEFSLPVNSDVVVFFDGVDEVMCVIFGEVFDAKLVYTEGECSFLCLVVL